MDQKTYDAFQQSISEVTENPVTFRFTAEEVEEFDVTVGKRTRLSLGDREERVLNLSEGGYPYLRAALIFAVVSER